MRRLLAIVILLAATAGAQTLLASSEVAPADPELASLLPPEHWDSALVLAPPAAPPRMSPELALETFQKREAERALSPLISYTALTTVTAELPDSNQHGQFRLLRRMTAPGTLAFTPISYSGDGFVKTNVINRWLTSEVERAAQPANLDSALIAENYKFVHKGHAQVDGREVEIFELKPRRKAAGLFRGTIAIDSQTGSLVRAEGTLVHSPSFFIKKIEFASDFRDFNGAWMPIELHSTAYTRLIGRAVVEVSTPSYNFNSNLPLLAAR